MESKNISTKTMEKDGQTAGTRKAPLGRAKLVAQIQGNFYANLKKLHQENANAPVLGPQDKKKGANDIIKKNMAAAALQKKPASAAAARKQSAGPGKSGGGGPLNVELKTGPGYKIANPK